MEDMEFEIETAVAILAAAPKITLTAGDPGYLSGERPDWYQEGIHLDSRVWRHGEVPPVEVLDLRPGTPLTDARAACPVCEDGYHTTPTGAGRCVIIPAVIPAGPIPGLAEAALRLRVAYIAEEADAPGDPRRKIVLGGAGDGTTPGRAPFEAFLKWAAGQGLMALYGDPARGEAGGYLK